MDSVLLIHGVVDGVSITLQDLESLESGLGSPLDKKDELGELSTEAMASMPSKELAVQGLAKTPSSADLHEGPAPAEAPGDDLRPFTTGRHDRQ